MSDTELRDLAAWCQDWCEATGDGRYCILAGTLGRIDDWWDEQGVPSELLGEVEMVLTSRLPAIIDADPSSGSLLAVGLREEVAPLLMSSAEWVAQGYVVGPPGAGSS